MTYLDLRRMTTSALIANSHKTLNAVCRSLWIVSKREESV